jgi:hypothetical protein
MVNAVHDDGFMIPVRAARQMGISIHPKIFCSRT